jgi:hypothetical protein
MAVSRKLPLVVVDHAGLLRTCEEKPGNPKGLEGSVLDFDAAAGA